MSLRDRKTPLTDAYFGENCGTTGYPLHDARDFARRLEQDRDAAVEALKRLLATHDEDIGMDEYPDNASVGWENGKEMKLTFGDLRFARAVLAEIGEKK